MESRFTALAAIADIDEAIAQCEKLKAQLHEVRKALKNRVLGRKAKDRPAKLDHVKD